MKKVILALVIVAMTTNVSFARKHRIKDRKHHTKHHTSQKK